MKSSDDRLSRMDSYYKTDLKENEPIELPSIQKSNLNSLGINSNFIDKKPNHVSSKYIHYVTISRLENLLKLTKKNLSKRSIADLDFETRVRLDEIKLKVSIISK